MKECPYCGYKNADNALHCDICHADLISVRPLQKKKIHKKNFISLIQIFVGIFFICAAAYVLYPDRFLKPRSNPAKVPDVKKLGYDVSSVIESLEKMGNIKFIGQEEKESILSLATNSTNALVRAASIRILGTWVRNREEESSEFVKKIVESFKDSNPAVRAESAWQIGLILLTKTAVPGIIQDIKDEISILLNDTDESVRVNAVFLAAMTKDALWLPEFKRLFKNDISNTVKFQSVCSLAYFGDSKAIESVLKACTDANMEIRKKAIFCLAYINAKDSERILKTVIDSDSDKSVRNFAKFSLNFREQLAIINNKSR